MREEKNINFTTSEDRTGDPPTPMQPFPALHAIQQAIQQGLEGSPVLCGERTDGWGHSQLPCSKGKVPIGVC